MAIKRCVICLKEFIQNGNGENPRALGLVKRSRKSITCSKFCSFKYNRLTVNKQKELRKKREDEQKEKS